MKEMIKPVLALALICIITSGLLAATYGVTKPLIAAAEEASAQAAMVEVLPSATSFVPVQVDGVEGVLAAVRDESGAGYVFHVQSKGFGGAYQVMVGIGSDGKVAGTKLMANSETPGLGSKSGESAFTGQFIGKDSALDGVETITGATVSSNAFISCIDTAFAAYASIGEVVQ